MTLAFDWVGWALVVGRVAVVFAVLLVSVMLVVWLERKFVADMQMRLGPTRAGPFGILITLADGRVRFESAVSLHHVLSDARVEAALGELRTDRDPAVRLAADGQAAVWSTRSATQPSHRAHCIYRLSQFDDVLRLCRRLPDY